MGCYEPQTLSLIMPQLGVESSVPLDVILEVELVTKSDCRVSLGCGGRYSPIRAEPVCSPANSCLAETTHLGGQATLALRVVGLKPGPAVVTVRYQQPDQAHANTWESVTLPLQFVAARKPAPTLALGGAVPKSLGRLESVPDALARADIHPPALCEARDEYRTRFTCFSPERWSGLSRYPSCAFTGRCAGSAPPLGGFFADVRWNGDGLIEWIALTDLGERAELLHAT